MNNKLQVNLVSLSFPKRDLSISLLYLKNFVMSDPEVRDRVNINILQFDKDESVENIVDKLRQVDGNIFGFGTYVWNIEKVLKIVSILKKRGNIRVILGGPQASALKFEYLKQNDAIDFIVSGEGEVPFYNLLKKRFLNGEPLKNLKGVAYKKRGTIYYHGDEETIQDLSKLPFPHFSSEYSEYLASKCETVTAQLETTRGCPFTCRYCSWYNKQKVRKFDLEKLKDVFRFLLNHPKIGRIYVTDSNSFIYKSRQKEILRFITENNPHKKAVIFEVNPEFLDDELTDLVAQMGAEELAFGLQSTSELVLGNINRKFNYKRYCDNVLKLKERFPNIKTWFGLILGLPGDTYESFLDSLEFAIQLRPYSLYIHELLVLPGSEFFNKASEFKITFSDKPPHKIISNGTMSSDEYNELKYLGFSISLLHHVESARRAILNFYDESWDGRLVDLFVEYINYIEGKKILPTRVKVSNMDSIDFDPTYESLKNNNEFVQSLTKHFNEFKENVCLKDAKEKKVA